MKQSLFCFGYEKRPLKRTVVQSTCKIGPPFRAEAIHGLKPWYLKSYPGKLGSSVSFLFAN